jgi:hypothetical protein
MKPSSRARTTSAERRAVTTDDVAASAEAARLGEEGIERRRAVTVAGEALQYGYTAEEMRQFCWVVMTARMHGGPPDQVLGMMEQGIRAQRHFSDMVGQMWQCGWMGPADEHGGHGMDGTSGGGPGGHMGEDHRHGGGGHMSGDGK